MFFDDLPRNYHGDSPVRLSEMFLEGPRVQGLQLRSFSPDLFFGVFPHVLSTKNLVGGVAPPV
jgi:hypothetical protein